MKTKFTIALAALLMAGWSALPVQAGEKVQVGVGADSAAITETYRTLGEARLSLGATRSDVLWALGRPTFKLSPHGWVYENIQATQSQNDALPYTALVVVFNDRGAISYRLVNERMLAVLTDDARMGSKDAMAIAASSPSKP